MKLNHPSITVNNLTLDLDGSRRVYHPNDEGIDFNFNGGISKEEASANSFPLDNSRGYGIAKKISKDETHLEGYLQPNGYYVSQTTPYYSNKSEGDPDRYADAEVIPYIVYSPGWKSRNIRLGDIAYVINLENKKTSFAIFADYRNNDNETELSLALAKALNIPVTTEMVSTYDGKKKVMKYTEIETPYLQIFYFAGSGDGEGKTLAEINTIGKNIIKNKN